MSYAGRATIGVAALGLAVAYALHTFWAITALIVLVGVLWLLGQERGWDWTAHTGLGVMVGAAALGTFLGLPAFAMLGGTVAALVAWDVDRFLARVRAAGRVHEAGTLVRAHLRRMLAVAGLGLVLGGIGLRVEIELSLVGAMILGALALAGLRQALRLARR